MLQPLTKPLFRTRLGAGLLLLAAASHLQSFAQTPASQAPSRSPLWDKTFATLEHAQLADPANAYDFAHYLMVPMHRVFETGDLIGEKLFDGLVSDLSESSYAELNLLSRMQLDYFVSEFLVLKSSKGKLDAAGMALFERQWDKFERYWTSEPFKHWVPKPFAGVRGRLVGILSQASKTPGQSYLAAATDFELFGLAIAANLDLVGRNTGVALPENEAELASEAGRLTSNLVQSRGEFLGDGWLFQRGYWRDHKDFLYAGHDSLGPDLKPAPVENVAQDSSHAIRWALWIRSFYRAAGNEQDKALYKKVAIALSAQYRGKVIRQTPEGLTMKNYMDGQDGIYRYKYSTIGSNAVNGYGPGALSGSIFIGWLCFLPNMEVQMNAMFDSFPLTPRMIKLYTGPNTTRERNLLLTQPEIYTNGTAEIISNLGVGCAESSNTFWHGD